MLGGPGPVFAAPPGPAAGTLAACEGHEQHCVSSHDDRGPQFAPPWELPDGADLASATADIERAVGRRGGEVRRSGDGDGYVWAAFAAPLGATDDVELVVLPDEGVVVVRSCATNDLPDLGRNARRLDGLRSALGWAQVPVLRNRSGPLGGVLESPFDRWGPEPPPDAALDVRRPDDAQF